MQFSLVVGVGCSSNLILTGFSVLDLHAATSIFRGLPSKASFSARIFDGLDGRKCSGSVAVAEVYGGGCVSNIHHQVSGS